MLKIGLTVLGIAAVAGVSHAQEAPLITGTWTGTADTITKQEGRSTADITYEITDQQGSTFVGRVLSDGNEVDDFVGVIAPNGRDVYWVDDDGQTIGTLTAPDTLELCYIEIADENQASCLVATRSGS